MAHISRRRFAVPATSIKLGILAKGENAGHKKVKGNPSTVRRLRVVVYVVLRHTGRTAVATEARKLRNLATAHLYLVSQLLQRNV